MRHLARTFMLLALPTFAFAESDPKQTVVEILMFDGVQIIDYAAPYEVFHQAGFTVLTVSKDGKSVRAAQGLRSEVDHSFASAPAARIVLVPGGAVQQAQDDAATLEWLRKQASGAEHVLSVCTGSFILGRSGLLDGGSATTFHTAIDYMQSQFPKVKVVRDQRWVDNGKVVTSAGLASGIDSALHVVAEVRGLKVARSVAMKLEYDWKPEAGFVRGRLADRNFRLPSTLRIPDGTRIDEVTSVGDDKTWEIEFEVESPLPPAGLLKVFGDQAKQDPAFSVKAGTTPERMAWEFDSPYGRRWRVSHTVKPDARPNHYRIVATLAPVR